MKILKHVGWVLLALCAPLAAQAAQWEIRGGSSSSLLLQHESDNYGDHFEFAVNASASYYFFKQLALTARPSFQSISGDNVTSSRWSFRLTVGPTYDFSEDTAQSFFVTAQAGFRILNFSASGNTYAPFDYFLGVGRRVALSEHVTWTPEFAFWGNTRATADNGGFFTAVTSYELILFQFSILL
jgi:hypothetical protein